MRVNIGIFAGIITACLLGGGGVLVKVLMNRGVHAMMVIFLSHLCAAPMLAVLMYYRKISFKVSKRESIEMLIVSLMGMGPVNITMFLAFDYIPVGQAATVHYMYPAIILVLELLVFRVRISKPKWIAIVMCLAGILFLAQTSHTTLRQEGFLLGIILAFASAVFNALYFIRVDHSVLKLMNTVKLSFYMCLLTMIQPLIFSLYLGVTSFDHSAEVWMILIIFGFLASVVATICLQISIKYSGAVTSGIATTLQPIMAVVAGVLFLKESFTPMTVIACAFIVSAILIIALSSGISKTEAVP